MKKRKFADGGSVGRRVLDYITPKRPITPQSEEEFAEMASGFAPVGTVGSKLATLAEKMGKTAPRTAKSAAFRKSMEEAAEAAPAGEKLDAVQKVSDEYFGARRAARAARKAEGYAKGGSVGSASRRADGIAKKGKTKGRLL